MIYVIYPHRHRCVIFFVKLNLAMPFAGFGGFGMLEIYRSEKSVDLHQVD